ncbi:MAG TPA: deoxycytidine deaminase, partial [Allocoleopsis sp.]
AKASVTRPPDRDDIWQQLREKANQEKQIQLQKREAEKDREKGERQARILWMSFFAVVALVVGLVTSLINPVIGASLAAVIGGVSPLVVEILKPK